MNVFVSVGSTANPAHETFVKAVEDRLRAEGLTPLTVGRNYFTSDSPFIGVNKLMDDCRGVVVIALERIHVESATEKRGSAAEGKLRDVKLATPWNQIEATLAYSRKLPLLVLVEQGVRQDGLLEQGFDWYVLNTPLEPAALATSEFNGVLASWTRKLSSAPAVRAPAAGPASPADMTVGQLLGALKPAQLWSVLGALAAAFAATFALGGKLFH
ncbi:hypothetical protein LXT12_23540 [Pelomonas sp. P7]|uniref:Uncharacterized protein n=1 Tax=Pelomonas caseinilytica TaxID=2906763 RepID=A0ABS8XKL1_9BURK|nr:hypothetical protein [Pelomonas sp. P7]MCE4540230.1 hypothetical protein [Pelomonas sp. P7]